MSTIKTGTTLTTAYQVEGDTTGALVIQTGATPTTAMTVGADQNVGIGTSSPSDTQSFGKAVDLRGTTGSAYYSGTTDATTRAYFATYTGGAYLGTETNHPQVFRTNNTERARIDSSGLLVGTTTNTYGTASVYAYGTTFAGYFHSTAYGLGVRSATGENIYFYNGTGGAPVGAVSTTGSATSYVTSSDYRLKENIQPMTGALDKVIALKPCTYNWKADGSDGQGFIAHELQEVVPDCVTGEKDAVDENGNPVYQGIDTSFLVATLTAAIQELKAELDAAKADIATLKGAA